MSKLLQHKHLIVDADILNPPTCPESIQDWMKDLIEQIDMKIMMGPYASYCDMPGNRGLTAVTIIETSHIAIHVWDEVTPAKASIDVYTCSELDIEKVFNAIKVFTPTEIRYKYLNRDDGLIMLDEGNRIG